VDILLSIQNLTKRFGTQIVIKNLSFSIQRGNRVTLFAPSGSGKTTLINILSHLDRQFEGSFDLTARKPATIFQEPRLFPYMTVQENIFFPFRVQQTPITPAIQSQYDQWLSICDLTEYVAHYPYQLSGGMKQKVALIRSFLTAPDFVMLDEPFKSLDIASKNRIIRHILQQYPDVTMLFVTHNLDEIPVLTRSLMLFKTNKLTTFTAYADVDQRQAAQLFTQIFQELSI
jgi:ABC-type nitrate/sulfonate/bicarbonate transport system ATPase subunit